MTLADWLALIAAAAALLTFWIMLTTARRQLRAYVGVNEIPNSQSRKLELLSDGTIKGLALARNHGKTPATMFEQKS